MEKDRSRVVYRSYGQAAEAYLAEFRALRDAPRALGARDVRAADDEALVKRADRIADVSARMVSLAKRYLNAKNPALREGISGQLLTQAAAELRLAAELFQLGEGQAARPMVGDRALEGAGLRDAIVALEESMAVPLSKGLGVRPRAQRGLRVGLADEESAKSDLRLAVEAATGAITQQVCELGGEIATDLILNTQWGAVVEGASLLHKDVAKLLEQLRKGAGTLVARATATASKTLLNAYDKVLALMGKDLEDQARQTVRQWLERIKQEGKIDLFEVLVTKLYRVEGLKGDLEGWLNQTTADAAKISATSGEVSALAEKFALLASRLGTLENVIGLAKMIKLPQVLVIVAGLQVTLLAVTVYLGYDYIGYKPLKFPNLTQGVGEVIRANLLV